MMDELLFPFGEMGETLRGICSAEKLFDLYRLVDPNTYEVYDYRDGQLVKKGWPCYGIWKRNSPCSNCVSRHCCNRKQQFFKLEYLDGIIFLILAVPVTLSGRDFSLELVKDVTNCISVGESGKAESMEVLDMITRYNHLVVHDSFTGLYNKLYISDQLEVAAKSGEGSLVGALLDLDNFKSVNDTYGHFSGDQVLRGVAGVLDRQCGKSEIWAGRLGGDEFCLFFQGVELEEARAVCREAAEEIERLVFRKNQQEFRVTVSMGIARMEPGDTQETFLDRLDALLYEEKNRKKKE